MRNELYNCVYAAALNAALSDPDCNEEKLADVHEYARKHADFAAKAHPANSASKSADKSEPEPKVERPPVNKDGRCGCGKAWPGKGCLSHEVLIIDITSGTTQNGKACYEINIEGSKYPLRMWAGHEKHNDKGDSPIAHIHEDFDTAMDMCKGQRALIDCNEEWAQAERIDLLDAEEAVDPADDNKSPAKEEECPPPGAGVPSGGDPTTADPYNDFGADTNKEDTGTADVDQFGVEEDDDPFKL